MMEVNRAMPSNMDKNGEIWHGFLINVGRYEQTVNILANRYDDRLPQHLVITSPRKEKGDN